MNRRLAIAIGKAFLVALVLSVMALQFESCWSSRRPDPCAEMRR